MRVDIKFITFTLVFICFLTAGAQNKDLYNVKLKSGLIIKCELISFLPDSTVSIRQYGMISTIDCREIISIEHSGYNITYSDTARNPIHYTTVKPKVIFRNLPEKVWTCGIQLCLNVNGGGRYEGGTAGTAVKLSALTGLNKHLEVGFCTGLDYYFEEDWLLGIVAGQARYCILANRYKTPMIYTQLGYGFKLSDSDPTQNGGVNFASGIGMASRTKAQDIFCVMVGFKMQKLTGDPAYRWPPVNTSGKQDYILMGVEAKVEWRF